MSSVSARADAAGVLVRLGGVVVEEVGEEALDDPVAADHLLGSPSEGMARAERPDHRDSASSPTTSYDTAEAHEHTGRVGSLTDNGRAPHAKLGYPERCRRRLARRPGAGSRGEPRADHARDCTASAEIVRVTESDGGLLSWFEAAGFMPGAHVASGTCSPEDPGRRERTVHRRPRALCAAPRS